MSVSISLSHLSKSFIKNNNHFKAVDDVHIEVNRGELVTFLGPSGCGKTTTLRMIAGFETPTRGSIAFDGKDVTHIMVNKRDIGFVFQNYALFPHMNIFDNVAFGLRARHQKESDIQNRVYEYLELVDLKNTGKRFPNQLSGGEQQRVALARVLVLKPQVLLMDEPLSNLDAKLRIQMRTEIRRLQKQLNITCLYVTHDQKEALTLADRIIVMNRGRVEQDGSPFDVYSNPKSLFVADFIGQANVIYGKAEEVKAYEVVIHLENGARLTARRLPQNEFQSGKRVAVIARPESLALHIVDDRGVRGTVLSRMFVGDRIDYEIRLWKNCSIHVEERYLRDNLLFNEGEEVSVEMEQDLVVLPE